MIDFQQKAAIIVLKLEKSKPQKYYLKLLSTKRLLNWIDKNTLVKLIILLKNNIV